MPSLPKSTSMEVIMLAYLFCRTQWCEARQIKLMLLSRGPITSPLVEPVEVRSLIMFYISPHLIVPHHPVGPTGGPHSSDCHRLFSFIRVQGCHRSQTLKRHVQLLRPTISVQICIGNYGDPVLRHGSKIT